MTTNNPNDLGNLAYYDSFQGLIPCKVTAYDGFQEVYFTVTANHGAYRKGEKLHSLPAYVVPRKMVHIRDAQYLIRSSYTWVNGVYRTYAIRTRGKV